MKKTLTVIAMLVAGSVSVYSQGQFVFEGYVNGAFGQQIFNTQPTANDNYVATFNGGNGTYTVDEEVGATAFSKELPAGTQVYAAGTALTGTGYDAQLIYAPTANAALSTLTPFGSVLNFYTATAAVGLVQSAITETIPGVASAPITIGIAAWNNEGGTITTLAEAQAAGDPWGISPVTENVTLSSGSPATPAPMVYGAYSFSLGTSVPEPSTIALGVMGVSALLFRRRK